MKNLIAIRELDESVISTIQAICKEQLESLTRINAIDSMIWLQNHGYNSITQVEFEKDLDSQKIIFEEIFDYPHKLFILDSCSMAIFKTILVVKYFDEKGHTETFNDMKKILDLGNFIYNHIN